MKNLNMLFEKMKKLLSHFRQQPKTPQAPSSQKKVESTSGNLQSMAYHLIGNKTQRFLPFFRDLDVNLKSAGLKINFKAYISLTVFLTTLTSLTALAAIPCLLFFVLNIPLLPAILFGVGGSLFAVAFTTLGLYGYPIYRADVTKRQLEDELPFTTGYMAILTSAGVSPESIFNSLSNLPVPLAISAQSKDIMRDVKLFGSDIISALEEASKRTPSERFREMIEGFISTIHSGGNLAAYLREKSTQYMKLKRIGLKKYADTLSMLSEFYVAILLTGPLMLIIMLTVMAMLGSGIGMLCPDFLLSLLTYLGIPLGAVVFLIILDAISPKW